MCRLASVLLLLAAIFVPVSADAKPLLRPVAPPDGYSYFGFTFALFDSDDLVWGDTRPFAERIQDSITTELAGKTPTFLNVWATWQNPDVKRKPLVPLSNWADWIGKVQSVVDDRGVVYLDWNITLSTAANEGITTKEIAAGKLDHYIRTYARDVREYGRPLLVRLFNGEYNGDWWYGVSPRANPSLTTRDFVVAWRRVVDIFHAVGAGNVSWAWVVNAYPHDPTEQPEIDRDIAAYYPGDDYVDWIGADFYDVGLPDWLDGPYAFAVTHGKPFFVAEFGIRHPWSGLTTSQQRVWLDTVFDYFQAHPAIKGISYFNLCYRGNNGRFPFDPSRVIYVDGGRVNYVPDLNDGDSRLLAGGPEMRALFSRRISSPRYVSAVATETVDLQPQQPTAEVSATRVRNRIASVSWSGNFAADRFDLAVLRTRGGWRTVLARTTAHAYRVRAARGVRVRAYDVDGRSGPWSAVRYLPRR